ncbi:MAG TPA: prohibitin family protein [Pseudomonadales bacterium]
MKNYLLGVYHRLKYGVGFTALILLFLLIVLWDRVVFMVPPGHGAVVWHSIRANLVRGYDSTLVGEGLEIILPWDRFYLYDLRLQSHTETYHVVSQEGLHFEIDMSVRWRVVGSNLLYLNRDVGLNYLRTMILPDVGSILREIVAQYPAEALYTIDREMVQDAIYEELTAVGAPNHIGPRVANAPENTILLEDTLLTNIRLPESLKAAIERKLSEAELVDQYTFRVARERLESERKQVEAEGIRNFQETVAPAITPSYLEWRGIEATLELAKSPNSKVVVIGNSSGLPLILDTQENTLSPAAAAAIGSSGVEE